MSQKTATADRMVPLSRGTLLWRLTREQVLRRVALGEIEGELRGRYWFVAPPATPEPHR